MQTESYSQALVIIMPEPARMKNQFEREFFLKHVELRVQREQLKIRKVK